MSEHKRFYDLLVKSLRYSLGIDRQSPMIPAEDLDVILQYVRKQAILPLLSDCLAISPKTKEQLLLLAYRFEQYESILKAVSSCFSKEQIVFVVLKGSVTNRYYPKPWMRTRSDVDILVKREQLESAVNALVRHLGFAVESRNYHDVSMRSKNGLFLELHFSLFEKNSQMDQVLSTVWDHTAPKKEGLCEYVMSDTFFLFHQLTHTAYHFANGGCGVRFVVDLWLLKKNLKVDEEELQRLCQQSGIYKFYLQICKLMNYWFADEAPDDLLLQMEAYLMDGTVFGTTKNRVAIEQKRNGGQLGYLFSRLFWSYEDLKELYPSLEGKKHLLLWYQFRRWLRLLNPKKFKTASEHLSIGRSSQREEGEKLFDFLTRVGL